MKNSLLLVSALLVLLPVVVSIADDEVAQPVGSDAVDQHISKLIDDLAHPSYAVRARARYELESYGLVAMDAIRQAAESTDTEIAFAARFLLSRLDVRWARETDHPDVRHILVDYGDLSADERKSRMDRLANLPDRVGSLALARLARFEQNLQLSRWAALLAMRVERDAKPVDELTRMKMQEVLGDSDRASVRWLNQYLSEVERKEYEPSIWRDMIEEERRLIDESGEKDKTVAPILVELYRVCAARALEAGQQGEALELALACLDKVLSRRQDLLDAVTWGLDTGLNEVVLELHRREPHRFMNEPELLYGLAEAVRNEGDVELASQYQAQALAINALPEVETENSESMRADELERLAMRHRELGRKLAARGLFDWAAAEYRHVIDRMPVDSLPAANNRLDLVEIWGYENRHQDIVDVLEPLIDRLKKDRSFLDRFRRGVRQQSADGLEGLAEYHRGLAATGEAAWTALKNALNKDRDNVDIMIAMLRLEGEPAWQTETRQEIERAQADYLRQVALNEESYKRNPEDDRWKERVAVACNQYAWLVANTFGDYANAIRLSTRSIELYPENSAFLDTLALCYFAAGKVDEAAYYQRQALRSEPHHPVMKRQLEKYLAEAAENHAPAK